MPRYLSKSDFILARDCPRKLYYKKRGYPSKLEENEYLQYLADGGFMVERIAQLLYPDGHELDFDLRDPEGAAASTRKWIRETATGTLFEAVVIAGGLMARVDILHKDGDRLDLIEVKSTSINTDKNAGFRGARGGIAGDKRTYVEDVTFQTQVLRDAYPEYRITPYLCVADKAKRVTDACTLGHFHLERPEADSVSRRTVVHYNGDVGELPETHPLAIVNVSDLVDGVAEEIREASARFAASVCGNDLVPLPGPLAPSCRDCEYRIPDGAGADDRNGFAECWGDLAQEPDHIVDLYWASWYGGGMFNELVTSGSADIKGLDASVCTGSRGARQRIQIEHTRSGTEYLPPELKESLRGHEYPLHFIDFEAARPVIPFHAGMRPYELVTFQWSCHTIREMDAARDTRVVDLNKLALASYFHPLMKGKTSIKAVLPAVLAALPALALPDGSALEAVREGTGAMRAYGEMLFGTYARDREYRDTLRDLLLQYCELDTAAMVMIWDHWVG